MSLPGAVCFEIWALGALMARPDRGIMVILTSATSAGTMARRLLPMAILIPALLGALRVLCEHADIFSTETGASLFTASIIVIFSLLLWSNAKLLFFADIERERSRRRLVVQYNCTRVLGEAAGLKDALPGLLQSVGAPLGWRAGAAWLVDAEQKQLRCTELWQAADLKAESFIKATRDSKFTLGEGLPGRVWATGLPFWITDLSADKNFPRAEPAAAGGLRSAFAFPVKIGSEIVGVMEFFSSEAEPPDKMLLEMLTALGSQIGQFTERRRAVQQLRQASSDLARSNTDLQQFAYVASHDLFEPLRMVISFLQLLQERLTSKLDKQSEEFIRFALDGAHRMQALISDLLDYSRVGIRGRPFGPTNAEQALNAAVGNLKVAIEESGATVAHQALPTVHADAVQLTQVFQNLVGNALKFHGSKPPHIEVAAQQRDHEWCFSVSDNGIGIDPKHFNRIFEIFQRLHTRQEYSGTGIGLAICKRIIERHGGRIWVESTPGQGSTFFFTLPESPSLEGER